MRTRVTYCQLPWILAVLILISAHLHAQAPNLRIRKKDRRSDIEMITSEGRIRLRLSDATPIHRDNFIRLVKTHFYEGIAFHRVIRGFMIQAGDPKTRDSSLRKPRRAPDSAYTIPAEIVPGLFHHRGVLAAARMGDLVNPSRASSGTQFYLVQGKIFSPSGLDSVETFRLNGRKIPAAQRDRYLLEGGAPHLDAQYTIFGEVIAGMEIIDSIAGTTTTGKIGNDRPLEPIRIQQVRFIRRQQ